MHSLAVTVARAPRSRCLNYRAPLARVESVDGPVSAALVPE